MKLQHFWIMTCLAFCFSSCNKSPQTKPKIEIDGKSLSNSAAQARLKVMPTGNLETQRQAIKLLQDHPAFIAFAIPELVQIAKTPIDYAYVEEIRQKANASRSYTSSDSDPKILELKQRMELRKSALEIAIGVDSKEAFDLLNYYAVNGNPADANMAGEILRAYRFRKGREETGLPSAWFKNQMYPANEYAEKVQSAFASEDAEQMEVALNSFRSGLAKDMKFPNLAPFIDYFNQTAFKSASNHNISQTRQTIASLMSQSEDPRVYPFLTNAVKDSDPTVAEAASRALGADEEWHKSEN